MYAFSDPCPVCSGVGRVLSKESIAMKIERWFLRASTEKGKTQYQLVASPQVIDALTESAANRLTKLEKRLNILVDVIRDTSFHPEEYHIIETSSGTDLTEKYRI
jgi:Ribonuclease G/E